jgi:hypothetical protein
MMSTLMSERVSDIFLTQTQQFPAISWWEQVNFQRDDDEARFDLDQHALLDILVLAH